MLVSALLIAWILVDPAFDGMGEGIALLGLAGHRAANPAALMLLGATMLMAWQSSEPWRGRWQYAAFGAGLLFTTSLSWAGIEPGTADTWHRRVVALLISTAMMTLLTRFGLARAIPRAGDWLVRARRASLSVCDHSRRTHGDLGAAACGRAVDLISASGPRDTGALRRVETRLHSDHHAAGACGLHPTPQPPPRQAT